MRLALLNKTIAGRVLQKPLFSSSGSMVLSSGITLTSTMITRLSKMGFVTVYIDDDLADDVHPHEILDFLQQVELLTGLKRIFTQLDKTGDFDDELAKSLTRTLIDNAQVTDSSMVDFGSLGQIERNIYTHALNVGVLSMTVGVSMGLPYDQLCNLTTGALLHDIGKAVVDGPEHPRVGFNLIRRHHSISIYSAHCAFSHHEHVNGTGYPRGVMREDIVMPARIVALCNYYENLLGRADTPQLPHEAQEAVAALTGTQFDPDVYEHFRKAVCVYPNGLPVRLTTGEHGLVVRQNSGFPLRPVVRVKQAGQPRDLDLLKDLTIFIGDANVADV